MQPSVDIRRFIPLLKHTRGDFSGQHFLLQGWQDDYLNRLFNTKNPDGLRTFRTSLLALPRKNGKALAIDTPVRTTSGWKTMGDVAVGDCVFHPSGRPTKVVAVTDATAGRPCYAVECDGGEVVVADESHLWASAGGVVVESCWIAGCGGSLPLPNGRQIVSCEPVESVPVRCIQVESEDGMFVVGRSLIPTHNSQLAAAIGLYMTFCDDEGAEVIVAAGDRSQAAILHDAAKQLLESCPALARKAKVYRNSIVVPSRNARMLCISSEAGTKHGYNPSCALIDEYHVFPDRELVDVLETGMGSRSQPLTIYITTAGTDMNGPCYKDWKRAEKIRDGALVDPTFLPCIFAADPAADPFAEDTWKAANPNYGVTLKPDYFRQFAAKAKESPSDETVFRTLHLNQWQTSVSRFFRAGSFEACGDEPSPGRDRPCYCGVDLASTFDTTAFVAVWPDDDGGFDVHAHFFIPADNAAKRAKEDRVPYIEWAREGFVTLTDGDVCDYDVVRDYIMAFCEKHAVRGVAIDRWNATHLTTQLAAEGIDMKPFGQGFGSMSSPTKMLEALVIQRKLRHGGNPVLVWQASNVQVKQDDAGNVKPSKKNSSATGRIDGVVALIMALGIASGEARNEPDEPMLMVL